MDALRAGHRQAGAAGAGLPVIGVTWQEATDCCRWLEERLGGVEVRLPTEDEWERRPGRRRP